MDAFEAAKIKGHGASLLVKDKTAIALAFIHDDTRDGSAELIAAMKERNINVEILSETINRPFQNLLARSGC